MADEPTDKPIAHTEEPPKKPYHSPKIEVYGTVSEIMGSGPLADS